MKHSTSYNSTIATIFIIVAFIFAIADCCLADPNWENFIDPWDPLRIEEVDGQGWSTDDGISQQWSGTVVADLDLDGEKEIIIADIRQIMVFDLNGNRLDDDEMRLNDQDFNNEDYRIRSIPSIGDINGDGIPDIVFTCTGEHYPVDSCYCNSCGNYHNKYGIRANTKLFAYSYIDDAWQPLADPIEFFGIKGETPVLVDIDVLPDGSGYEDGQMEIIMFGWKSWWVVGNYVNCPRNGYLPRTNSWQVIVLQLADGEFETLDEDPIIMITNQSISNNHLHNKYLIPAVGDMDGDGRKEICASYIYGYKIWTYDPDNNELIGRVEIPDLDSLNEKVAAIANWRFKHTGPVLADLFNTGILWAISPYHRPTTAWIGFFVRNINGENHENWNGLLEGWTYTGESVAVADVMNDGDLDLTFHSSSPERLYLRDYQNQMLWREEDNGALGEFWDGVIPSFARLGYGENVNILFANHINEDEEGLHAFSREDGEEIGLELDGESDYSVVAMTDMDNDGDLEVIARSFDGDDMLIYIWDSVVDIDTLENELCLVEWSQLKNGPRHTGLYAQVYEGTLPEGRTYWRDRVIVTDDLTLERGDNLCLIYSTPTVIEFNDCYLYVNGGLVAEYTPNPIPVVLKPNIPGGDWGIVFDRPGPDPPPDDPIPCGLVINNGSIIIEAGWKITFEDCIFTGEGNVLGDHIAIEAYGAEVNLINCTFKGYDTAVQLDSCTGSIENCTFEDANYNAVEILNCLTGVTIEDCEIHHNDGAAIYVYNSYPDIENCDIYDNDCDVYGAAVYSYNGSPHLRDNDIHDNVYNGIRAIGGGCVKMTTYNTLDPHRNRIKDNNTITHTVREDSTWAELIQKSPSSLLLDKGHNDIINDDGDYLISNWNYGAAYMLYATYNYWSTPTSLGPEDFYEYGTVDYSNQDTTGNYIDDADDEDAAHEMFSMAIQKRDSGRVMEAYNDFRTVIGRYPQTYIALAALRLVHDCGLEAEVSLSVIQRYLTGVAADNGNSNLGTYGDRLANLCLVELCQYETAIENYEAALEDVNNLSDSLYYAIDLAYAELARINNRDGEETDATGPSKKELARTQRMKITQLMAQLNGMPLAGEGEVATVPMDHSIIAHFPNPFNSTTTIRYRIASAAHASLKVYDLNGRLVVSLLDSNVPEGEYTAIWKAGNIPSGVYICRLEAGEIKDDVKLVLAR